uniref:Alpha/beta hydrolase fold-3 domain-containing protein n=1 Tax=Oryza brachyantha TaxID=4533 RepID=J3KU84_ORYBR
MATLPQMAATKEQQEAANLARLDVAGIVSVVLPLTPEHRLPAAIDAGQAALLWLRDVASGGSSNVALDSAVERLRSAADFSRAFLIGDSAGGVLVHNVAARAGEAGAEPLDTLLLAGGVLLHPGAGVHRAGEEPVGAGEPTYGLPRS